MKYEIRYVNNNWEHPRDAIGNYIPQREHAKQKGCQLTVLGFDFSMDKMVSRQSSPDHFQLYEVETKGTPISPVFSTKDDLKTYLIDKGDYLMQKESDSKWNESDVSRLMENDNFSTISRCFSDYK